MVAQGTTRARFTPQCNCKSLQCVDGGGRGVSRKNVILTFDPNYHPYLKVLSIGMSGKIERCSWVVLKGIPHKAEF